MPRRGEIMSLSLGDGISVAFGSQFVSIIDGSTNKIGPTIPVPEFPVETSVILLAAFILAAHRSRTRKDSNAKDH